MATSGYKWIQLVSGNMSPCVNAALDLSYIRKVHFMNELEFGDCKQNRNWKS